MAKARRPKGTGSYDKIVDENGNILYYRFRVGIYDPITKKTKYKAIKARSKTLLKEKVEEWKKENGGVMPAPSVSRKKWLVRDWVEKWLSIIENRYTPFTVKAYRQSVSQYLLPRFGNEWIERVTSLDLQDLFDEMAKKVSLQTVISNRNHISACFSFAVKHDIIAKNPVKTTFRPAFKRPELQILDESDVKKILTAAKKGDYLLNKAYYGAPDDSRDYLIKRNYMIVLLAASVGMRLGEVLGLTWPCVDISGAQLEVKHSLQDLSNGRRVLKSPKTGSARFVTLPDSVAAELKKWRDYQAGFAEKYKGLFDNPLSLVFTKIDGQPVVGSTFTYRAFHNICKAAGLTSLPRVHDLRHFAASYALSKGVSVAVIAEQLGHSNISMTLNRYTHALNKSRDELKIMLNNNSLFKSKKSGNKRKGLPRK